MEANNMKAMREALVALSTWAKVVKDNPKDKTAIECAEFVEVTAKTALAEPPRNCDVGTVEEQTRRLRANCEKHKPTCKECKSLTDIRQENCWLKWAQMLYKEGGAK